MAEFIKSWKFMAIIIAILTAVVVGLLVFGIGTHAEAGLAEARPLWESTPIDVCASAYTGTPADNGDAIDATAHAVDTTNERLGFAAYVMSTTGCDTTVIVGAPTESGWRDPGGDAQFDAGRPGCTIRTANTGTGEPLALTLQHELGHCLGLAHDDFSVSIMFGGPGHALSPTPDRQFPPRITDADRETLRALYQE